MNKSLYECGEGWYPIIDKLLAKLKEIGDADGRPIEVMQIKEKFGYLRVYTNVSTDEIDAAIDAASKESEHTCEVCGQPGYRTIHHSGWLMTRCGKCWQNER